MLKAFVCSCTLLTTLPSFANPLPDQFIDRNQTLYAHHIFCGNPNSLATLKPAFIFNNSSEIQAGIYSFNSAFGQFSYYLSDSSAGNHIKQRALYSGQSNAASQQDNCIVKADDSLPAAMNQQLKTVTIDANDDANYSKQLEQYAMLAGRPAFGPGQFSEPKADAKLVEYDKAFHNNNQQILAAIQQLFATDSAQYQQQLADKFAQALAYAKQEDGSVNNKQYPKIEEPAVWTAISKQRYEDQLFRQNNEIDYDQLMQQNYDWLFSKVGRDSQLLKSTISHISQPIWQDNQLQQTITLQSQFDNGSLLSLDFIIKSQTVNAALFESLETISNKAANKRKSLDIQRNEPRKLLLGYSELDVYVPYAEVNLFFSQFRADEQLWTFSSQ